jgi:LPXTG-site transpeptidase (sortase) family protein
VLALALLAACSPNPDPNPDPAPASAAGQATSRVPAAATVAGVVPAAVRLPTIDVEDSLLRLGIAPDGTAEVPTDYDRVGWFDRGVVPGARGPTVLLGHVDSRSGPAVFHRLRELRAGDPVEVDRSDGTTARYVVTRTEQVAKDRFPTFAVFGSTGDDVLRLVTCSGTFDRGARSYTDNLVVHAAPA